MFLILASKFKKSDGISFFSLIERDTVDVLTAQKMLEIVKAVHAVIHVVVKVLSWGVFKIQSRHVLSFFVFFLILRPGPVFNFQTCPGLILEF